MKKDRLFNRPLIPCLVSFAGGILVAHALPPLDRAFGLPILIIISLCLLISFFCRPRPRAYLLLAAFFLTGTVLAPARQLPSRLQSPATARQKATIEGVVLEPPTLPGPDMARVKLLALGRVLKTGIFPLNEKLLLSVYRNAPPLRPGEKIRFTARLRTFKNFRNPGRYDYEKSMALQGITIAAGVGDGRSIVPMGDGKLPFFRGWIEKLQVPVRTFFDNSLDHRNAALFRALILGERQGINRNLRETFNRSGLGHVLAVSGLHIGLVAWAAFWLFKWGLSRSYRLLLLTDVRKWSAFLTCFPVMGYTFLAGCRVSSERAMIMVLAYLFSIVLGKEKDVWSTLSLAGLIILFLDPGALFTPSFQLSFAAVTGILWLTPPILKRLSIGTDGPSEHRSLGRSVFNYAAGLATVSFCALYFLLPLTAYYFHRIPLVSVSANLSTVPILGLWVLPWGLLSVLLLPLSPQLASFLLHISAWGLDIMMGVVAFWSSIPWASVWTVTPGFFETGFFYALTFFAFFAFQKKWARVGLAAIVFLTVMDVAFWIHRVRFNQDLEVVFLDVGKGNAALVCLPDGKTMMIDGGGFSDNRFDVGRMVIAPFLWHRKITTIDYLVLTHPQADHMNGLRFIAKAFHPVQFWYNGDRVETLGFRNLMAALEKQDVHIKEPEQLKDKISINGADIEVLHPDPGSKLNDVPGGGKDLNNRSMVLKVTFAGVSILFPGDIEHEGEKRLLSRVGSRVRSDILLSPHHGSKTSSSEAFLKMVAPRICVISSGEDRFNRFPDPLVLKRLAEIKCKSIRISHGGAVTVRVEPDGFVKIHSFLSGDSGATRVCH